MNKYPVWGVEGRIKLEKLEKSFSSMDYLVWNDKYYKVEMTFKLVFLQYFFFWCIIYTEISQVDLLILLFTFSYDSYSQDSHYTETSKESTGLTIHKVFIL